MDKHIPHTGDRKPNIIPGWDVEIDCARQSSLFWHGIWKDCGREKSGIIYDIMKKNRSIYHYKLRALRKNKQSKTVTKQSVSRGMLRNSPITYWKSTRAIRKINYNSTQVVDGTSGDATIANFFRGKYVSLSNSVESTDDELTELDEQSEIASKSDCPDTTGDENHYHEIRSSDVSNVIVKMKSDKISDDGLVYSNNFIYGTNLLWKCLGILFTAMIYHGFAPQAYNMCKYYSYSKKRQRSINVFRQIL